MMQQIQEHLEYLGYEVTQREEVYRATHPERWNLVLQPNWDGVLMQIRFPASEYVKENQAEFMGFINTMNQSNIVARCYTSDQTDFVMEAWWPGGYEREAFDRFLDIWDGDTRRRFPNEAFDKYIDLGE